VACAGAIWAPAQTSASWTPGPDIASSAVAAQALKPFGKYAFFLFCIGLFNAAVFAATIQPLSTAFTVCEGLGFESGVNRRWSEAPIFYWLFTLLIVVGAGVVLIPNFPLIEMILWSQVINGMLLPFVLIYMILLINRKGLMREWVASRAYNFVAWISVVIMIGLTLALVAITIHDLLQPASAGHASALSLTVRS